MEFLDNSSTSRKRTELFFFKDRRFAACPIGSPHHAAVENFNFVLIGKVFDNLHKVAEHCQA